MESTDARISCQKITQNTLPNHEMSEEILKDSVQNSLSIIHTVIKQGAILTFWMEGRNFLIS